VHDCYRYWGRLLVIGGLGVLLWGTRSGSGYTRVCRVLHGAPSTTTSGIFFGAILDGHASTSSLTN
jgi:hypothetical protein